MNNRWRKILKLTGKPILVTNTQQELRHGHIIEKNTFRLKIPGVSDELSNEIIRKIYKTK